MWTYVPWIPDRDLIKIAKLWWTCLEMELHQFLVGQTWLQLQHGKLSETAIMLQIQGKLWEQRTADPSSALKEPFQIHFRLLLELNLLKTSIIHILFFLFWIKFFLSSYWPVRMTHVWVKSVTDGLPAPILNSNWSIDITHLESLRQRLKLFLFIQRQKRKIQITYSLVSNSIEVLEDENNLSSIIP